MQIGKMIKVIQYGGERGCYKNTHDNCPHEELIDFIECPICKNGLDKYKCDICYGEGLLPSV